MKDLVIIDPRPMLTELGRSIVGAWAQHRRYRAFARLEELGIPHRRLCAFFRVRGPQELPWESVGYAEEIAERIQLYLMSPQHLFGDLSAEETMNVEEYLHSRRQDILRVLAELKIPVERALAAVHAQTIDELDAIQLDTLHTLVDIIWTQCGPAEIVLPDWDRLREPDPSPTAVEELADRRTRLSALCESAGITMDALLDAVRATDFRSLTTRQIERLEWITDQVLNHRAGSSILLPDLLARWLRCVALQLMEYGVNGDRIADEFRCGSLYGLRYWHVPELAYRLKLIEGNAAWAEALFFHARPKPPKRRKHKRRK